MRTLTQFMRMALDGLESTHTASYKTASNSSIVLTSFPDIPSLCDGIY